jgi:hypothetical protein
MIKKLAPFILIAAAIVLLSASTAAALYARSDDVRDEIQYDVMAERQFGGTVANRTYIFEDFVHFPLRMGSEITDVEIGPKDFVNRSGLKLSVGEMVTVIGMPTVVNGREMVIAREVRTVTTFYVLRDRNGQPMWKMGRPVQMDPERRDEPLIICGQIVVRRMQDIHI